MKSKDNFPPFSPSCLLGPGFLIFFLAEIRNKMISDLQSLQYVREINIPFDLSRLEPQGKKIEVMLLTQREFRESESCSVMSDSLRPHGLYSPWNSPGRNTGVGSLSLLQGIFPAQGSNPGLLHCGRILYQLSHKGSPRILEWVVYPFSSRSS